MFELYNYGYLGLFIASFLAATILPFSSEALLSLMLYNGYNSTYCIIIATVGNSLGSFLNYFLGRLGRWDLIEKYLKIKQSKIENFKLRVKRYFSITAFFTWLPFIGDVFPVVLGVLKANIQRTFFFITLGKLLRYIVWFYITINFI
jgi:membrane protein YqaA with SNARE-associated domain